MLVPLNLAHSPARAGTDERICVPGAATSGFRRSDRGVGPIDENPATSERLAVAPTVIALAALPGEPTEPAPKESPSVPAAIDTTTPASPAASTARVTRSRVGSTSGSPRERLITSIRSATAASMPAAISGEFPLSPTPASVGTVSAL